MKVIKDKLGLTTDTGQSAKGLLYLLATPIVAMPEGTMKYSLIILLLLVFAFVSYLTRGNIDPETAAQISEDFTDDDNLADVIRRGRQ